VSVRRQITAEERRLAAHRERRANWKNWGPYLSDRAWGTVREDYSPDGAAWDYFPHDHARSRVFRWNEDGLLGISDRNQYLCFGLGLWNHKDPILKERLFGLTGNEGNHGEDVKEYYFYLDATPTHSYMKALYKYPQRKFPYGDLVSENGRRGYWDAEYELVDTGTFDEDRYFDVTVEYAKAYQSDILMRIRATNHSSEAAPLHILPQLWFRNTWSWGYEKGPMMDVDGKPKMEAIPAPEGCAAVELNHPTADIYYLYCNEDPDLIFTENETNFERVFGGENTSPYVKDAFHRYVVDGEAKAVNPAKEGTKVAGVYHKVVEAGETWEIQVRLTRVESNTPFRDFDAFFERRINEADAFYDSIQSTALDADETLVQRQAFAGMIWAKQLFYYDIEQWLKGDPSSPPPPEERKKGRNREWIHLANFDIISMPDKWEYPWYATWDLAFHCIPLALIDADFAKRQLEIITREWYMHPNGQLPAYEWAFSDVNPPVHAWAVWRVYKIDEKLRGRPDMDFLEGIFHKLMLNFTWWVNQKDAEGSNIFQGGFLGLDNIGVFDRSAELPTGGRIDQSDGTSWMAAFCLQMLTIALELAKQTPCYQDAATKFFEHFLRIAHAMANVGGEGKSLWDEEDGFFYDALHLPDDSVHKLKVRSLVGLLPLFAVDTVEPETLDRMPDFERRMNWFIEHRPHLVGNMASIDVEGQGARRLFAILTKERLECVLKRMLDESEFFSDFGIRSISRHHKENPYVLSVDGRDYAVEYWPAESHSGLFGGNSNWRGPIWFPVNYLIVESLQKFHHYYGDDLKVECPTGSGNMMNLKEVATELSRRLTNIFLLDGDGKRPFLGDTPRFQNDKRWRDNVLFYEFFHGDSGRGVGASHQTGWTGLVAKLLQQSGGHHSES
jgi:hypothetical protein